MPGVGEWRLPCGYETTWPFGVPWSRARQSEQRIREAQENGEFDDLPGAGAPLELEDDTFVPEELRTAYRLLKNAGFVPPELEAHREIRQLEELLRTIEDRDERTRLLSRIDFLLRRAAAGRSRNDLRVESAYYEKVAEHLARRRPLRTE